MKAYHFTGEEANEDFYLIPAKLSKEIFRSKLEEIISSISNHDFISYKMTSAFFLMFAHYMDALEVYFKDHADDGKGMEVCLAVIDRLKSLATDDDYFPTAELGLVADIAGIRADDLISPE